MINKRGKMDMTEFNPFPIYFFFALDKEIDSDDLRVIRLEIDENVYRMYR
mgnify:CR=1 FL=1